MSNGFKRNTLLFSGAVLLTAYICWYLFKDDEGDDHDDDDVHGNDEDLYQNTFGKGKSKSADKMTRRECLDLLSKIISSQEKAKVLMNELVESILANNFKESLQELYARILPRVPVDPLEARGLTLFDLDYLVERYQNDPTVRDYIMKIMHIPQSDIEGNDYENITANEVVVVHEFMLAELEKLVASYKQIPNYHTLDSKTVTVALQAVVSAKVQQKFGFSHAVLDKAIMHNHSELGLNTKFAKLTMQMQSEMAEITGLYN